MKTPKTIPAFRVYHEDNAPHAPLHGWKFKVTQYRYFMAVRYEAGKWAVWNEKQGGIEVENLSFQQAFSTASKLRLEAVKAIA